MTISGRTVEKWIRQQIDDDPAILARYDITFPPPSGNMHIGRMRDAVDDYRAQHMKDWQAWDTWLVLCLSSRGRRVTA